MNKWDWRNVFEFVGLLAIVLSLVFVGIQMRQDHRLARAELGAGGTEALNDLQLIATDSEFARTFAKMLNEPVELTDEEMIQINSFLSSVKAHFIRECYLVQRGVYQECVELIRAIGPDYFGSTYAQLWWKQNWKPTLYLPEWVNDEILGLSNNSSRQELLQLRENL